MVSGIFLAVFSFAAFGQEWRKMNDAELRSAVPEKAPVIAENIETEFRTASGITNGRASVFGVVIITAGYEADGKYTHFLRTGAAIKIGDIELAAGDYIFGYRRVDQGSLRMTFYKARSGDLVGETKAILDEKKGGIYSFLIGQPKEKAGKIFIGRFTLDYKLD